MRKRYQTGSIQKATVDGKLVWSGLFYDNDGKRARKTLGPRSTAKPTIEIRNAMADVLRPINEARAAKALTADITVAAYAKNFYIPFGESKWKSSSAASARQRIRQHIIGGELASVKVRNLDRHNMQEFLCARGLMSYSVVNHLRWDLAAICDLAVSDGILPRNQAVHLFTPNTTKIAHKPVMSPEHVCQALDVLDLRERLFCRFAIYAGMRPGEIIALRWTDIDEAGAAVVDDRFYKGEQGSTKNRKPREAALGTALMRDLRLWRSFSLTEDGFIFASENLEKPVRYENVWQRDIKPRFQKIGIAWADFRTMRRTNASLMKAANVDPKVGADNRGHGLGVALEEYTFSTMAQKVEAIRLLEQFIAVSSDSVPESKERLNLMGSGGDYVS